MWTHKDANKLKAIIQKFQETSVTWDNKPRRRVRWLPFKDFLLTEYPNFGEKVLSEVEPLVTAKYAAVAKTLKHLAEMIMCKRCGNHAIAPGSKLICYQCRLTPEGKRFTRDINLDRMRATWANNGEAILAKAKARSLAKYGTEFPWQSKAVQKRKKANYAVKGLNHHFDDPAILAKQQRASFKIKTIEIAGRTFECQGYEPYAIEKAVKLYGLHNVFTQYDKGFKPLRLPSGTYYPDFYIKSKRLYVEIKSDYTLLHKSSYAKNKRKGAEAFAAGFSVSWVVYNPTKRKLIKLPQKWWELSKTDLAKAIAV